MTLVCSRRAVGESLLKQKICQESERSAGTDFSQDSKPYMVLKLPCDTHGHIFLPTQFLFSIGHSLHPCIACFSLAIVYTHAILVLHWSQLTPMHCLFFLLAMVYTHAILILRWSQLTPMHCLFLLALVHTHAFLVLHWSRLTPMHCLFLLALIHTHAILVLHWLWLTPCITCFLVNTLLILSRAGCICQLHPLSSSQVKAIFYKLLLTSDWYL